MLSSNGCPLPGASENLPAGLVYTHPSRLSGVLVVDRAIFGPGIALERATVRRAPAHVKIASGRVVDVTSTDSAVARVVETYLESHPDAGRVGILLAPTNYLVRSEVGLDRQDMLLPGVGVSLGYSNAETTKAPYDAPVQMLLLGRKQTVKAGDQSIVDQGRLAESLVEGIDPFR